MTYDGYVMIDLPAGGVHIPIPAGACDLGRAYLAKAKSVTRKMGLPRDELPIWMASLLVAAAVEQDDTQALAGWSYALMLVVGKPCYFVSVSADRKLRIGTFLDFATADDAIRYYTSDLTHDNLVSTEHNGDGTVVETYARK